MFKEGITLKAGISGRVISVETEKPFVRGLGVWYVRTKFSIRNNIGVEPEDEGFRG